MNFEQKYPLLKLMMEADGISQETYESIVNQIMVAETELQTRFNQFHEDNPDVYNQLVKMAREVVKLGFNRYSCRTLFEVMRWHSRKQTEGVEALHYKMNNDFCALYARKIMDENYDLKDLFDTRILKR